MKIPANVRSKLSKLLQNISFVESHRRLQDVIEWHHGKIGKKEVLICIWNFQKEYGKPLLQVDIYDNTSKSAVKSKADMIDSYEISHTGILSHNGKA